MKPNAQKLFIGFVISVSSILASCRHMPTQDMPTYVTYSDINTVSIDGSGHRVLTAESSFYSNILTTKYGLIFSNGNSLLGTMKYDGSDQRPLFPNIPWGDRYFSMDESKIVLSSEWFENNQWLNNLYLMNSDGSNLVPLAPPKGQYSYPHIAPNLDEIVFMRDGGIATINVDGSALQYIREKTDSTRCMYNLYVDEDRILYFERTKSNSSIRLYDKLTRQDKLIGTLTAGFPGYGRVLINGKLLYADEGTIKVLDINASSTSTLGQGYEPSYSKDGSKIVYVQGRSICTMNNSGGNQQIIYTEQNSTKSIALPQFSADDKMIIFVTSYTVVAP